MYPTHELNRLAAHKEALQRRIARRRRECVVAAACIVRPIAWLDRALGLWRQLAPWIPLAAVPLAFLRPRPAGARPLGALLRWLPVITGVWRGFKSATRG